MVRLYKKLREYDVEMSANVFKETVYFTFRKDGYTHCCPVHLDLIEIDHNAAEEGLLKHLAGFMCSIY